METSEFLSSSIFCITSKNTLFYVAKIIISMYKITGKEEKMKLQFSLVL